MTKPSNLAALQLFLSSDGLIHVGGHLGHSLLTNYQYHPLLLHHRSGYVKLLIQELHISAAHAGLSTMMTIMADSYHLLGARRLVKSFSHHCVKFSGPTVGLLPSSWDNCLVQAFILPDVS